MSVVYSSLFVALLGLSPFVAGHGAIVKATGDAGGTGMALGIDPNTPRDGTRRNPFQQDTTRFKGDAADTVGETLMGGNNDVETGTKAIMQMTGGDSLPQITQGGMVMMTLHQINGDGAGPYTCMMNADGTAQTWTQMQVVDNVPGKRGNERDGAMTDFPLNAQVAADQTCTGAVAGQENVCMVRCQNPARAGPFGGVVPVQMANAATGNSTASTGSTGSTASTGSTGSTGSTASTGNTGSTGSTTSTGNTGSTGSTASTSSTKGAGAGAGNTASTSTSKDGKGAGNTASTSTTKGAEDDISEEEDAAGLKARLVSRGPGRDAKIRRVDTSLEDEGIDPELLAELRADGEEI